MRTIQAIYEDGVFRPSEPVSLPEGTVVEVSLPDPDPAEAARARLRETIDAIAPEVLDRMEREIEEVFRGLARETEK